MSKRAKYLWWMCLLMLSTAASAEWRTVGSDEFKLLWKTLVHTELQVNPEQPLPDSGDILDRGYDKRIIIRYHVGVSAERFRDMTLDALRDNISPERLAPHWAEIEEFASWYLPVSKGDHYQLSWQQGEGLSLVHNTQLLGRIAQPEAAALILSVWLGEAAVSEAQREAFLQAWRQSLGKK